MNAALSPGATGTMRNSKPMARAATTESANRTTSCRRRAVSGPPAVTATPSGRRPLEPRPRCPAKDHAPYPPQPPAVHDADVPAEVRASRPAPRGPAECDDREQREHAE